MSIEMIMSDPDQPDRQCHFVAKDATPSLAQMVANAPINDDGRSEWQWFIFPNGDVALATFPQGEMYLTCEEDYVD